MSKMPGRCPQATNCAFYKSVHASAILRIKYATMYPYCNESKHETCMRWWLLNEGRDVPGDLLPDGGRDWFAQETNRAVPPKSRVLVVDDMPVFRKALIGLVQEASDGSLSIIEADSAESALELLGADTGDWTAVVTDYNMGDKTGYDLIRSMRANPAHSQLPAIVFSSDADEGKREQCARLPRVRWLPKRPDRQPFVNAWEELVVHHKV